MAREERNYSHRSLLDKLGVKPEHRVCMRQVTDASFVQLLNERLERPARSDLHGAFDMIFVQIDEPADLARIAPCVTHLEPNGSLWIFHPKGKNAAVKEAQVRATYLALDVVDNKISAYNETHTATRCVIPVAKRAR